MSISKKSTYRPSLSDVVSLAASGEKLDRPEAEALEANLAINDWSVEDRTRLLGYYFNQRGSLSADKKYGEHLSWFIVNWPEHEILRSSYVSSHTIGSERDLKRLKNTWLNSVGANSDQRAISNAINFLIDVSDFESAQELASIAMASDPANIHWYKRLAETHRLNAARGNEDCRQLALDEQKKVINLLSDNLLIEFSKLVSLSLTAERFEEANQLALQLIDRLAVSDNSEPCNVSWASYVAYITLARLALIKKEIVQARQYIENSFKNLTDTWRLEIAGPDLELLSSLVDLGEKDLAQSYLNQFVRVCRSESSILETWATDVATLGLIIQSED